MYTAIYHRNGIVVYARRLRLVVEYCKKKNKKTIGTYRKIYFTLVSVSRIRRWSEELLARLNRLETAE